MRGKRDYTSSFSSARVITTHCDDYCLHEPRWFLSSHQGAFLGLDFSFDYLVTQSRFFFLIGIDFSLSRLEALINECVVFLRGCSDKDISNNELFYNLIFNQGLADCEEKLVSNTTLET